MSWKQRVGAIWGEVSASLRDAVADSVAKREDEPEENRRRESADWRPAALRDRRVRRRAGLRSGARPVMRQLAVAPCVKPPGA